MRSVEKEWLKLTGRNKSQGKLVRFYDSNNVPKFEGRINYWGWGTNDTGKRVFKWAQFHDCRTLKKDLSTRKGSAQEREQEIPYDWQFIFVGQDKEISIPKTAGELTDDHIGMEFTFRGSPKITGVFQGFKVPKGTRTASEKIGVKSENPIWHLDRNGYFIDRAAKLIYHGTPSAKLDTDAQLAAYLNQELGKWMNSIGSNGQFPETYKLGEEVVRIIKEITQPTP